MPDQPSGDTSFNFEHSLAKLESIAGRLESGELSLEESMQAFEEGIKLTRQAQKALAAAEQKVQLLVEADGEPLAEPFHEDEKDS